METQTSHRSQILLFKKLHPSLIFLLAPPCQTQHQLCIQFSH